MNEDFQSVTDALWITGVNMVNSLFFQAVKNNLQSFIEANKDDMTVEPLILSYQAIVNALSKVESEAPEFILDSWRQIKEFMDNENANTPDDADMGFYFLVETVRRSRNKRRDN